MSRSGYSDGDYDHWATIRWRGAVAQAVRGKRGQAFLKEMLAALDALPEKKLIRDELQDAYDGNLVCALGAVGRVRGIDMERIDPEDSATVAGTFGIPDSLAREIMWMNDEGFFGDRHNPEALFWKMRAWIADLIREPAP